jgi:hypothetical protein
VTDLKKVGEDLLGGADCLPRGVELLGALVLRLRLEVGRFDPLPDECQRRCSSNSSVGTHSDVKLASTLETGVLQGLDDGGVRVLQRSVLSDEDNVDSVEETVVPGSNSQQAHSRQTIVGLTRQSRPSTSS